MEYFIQQLVNGITLGSIYGLIAIGYTMVYGILQLINFAHGEVLMIGAMISLTIVVTLQSIFPSIHPFTLLFLALLGSIILCSLLAALIEKIAYRPLRNAPRLSPLITAIGISIVLQTLAMIIWGPNPKVFPDHHDCIRAGLTESYEILYAEGNFTKEQINNIQLYARYTCTPIKDEGQLTT